MGWTELVTYLPLFSLHPRQPRPRTAHACIVIENPATSHATRAGSTHVALLRTQRKSAGFPTTILTQRHLNGDLVPHLHCEPPLPRSASPTPHLHTSPISHRSPSLHTNPQATAAPYHRPRAIPLCAGPPYLPPRAPPPRHRAACTANVPCFFRGRVGIPPRLSLLM
jgi:hypothetical protein